MGGSPKAEVPVQHTTPAPSGDPVGAAAAQEAGWYPEHLQQTTQAYVPTQGTHRDFADGRAGAGIDAFLGGSNPAQLSYDPTTQAQLREHRKATQIAGRDKALAELAAFRAPPPQAASSGGGGGSSGSSNDDRGFSNDSTETTAEREAAVEKAVNAGHDRDDVQKAADADNITKSGHVKNPFEHNGNTGGPVPSYNEGGMIDFGPDPLALNSGGNVDDDDSSKKSLASSSVKDTASEVAKSAAKAFAEGLGSSGSSGGAWESAKGAALEGGMKMLTGGLFNNGGKIPAGYNAGGWVGKRAKMLNDGGMTGEEAGMQAHTEMQGMTGPGMTGASTMMPEGSPDPETYDPNTYGYQPSGTSTKEQMEVDALFAKRDTHVGDQRRKDKSFDMAEKRKDDAHKASMQQKQEGHQESMKQKRSGPLG